jgi:hypothetical protein
MALLVSLSSVRTSYIKKLHFLSLLYLYILSVNYLFICHQHTGCGKFALRALSQCLASEFQSQGVHVAHVIIDGVIGPPRLVI